MIFWLTKIIINIHCLFLLSSLDTHSLYFSVFSCGLWDFTVKKTKQLYFKDAHISQVASLHIPVCGGSRCLSRFVCEEFEREHATLHTMQTLCEAELYKSYKKKRLHRPANATASACAVA